MNFMRSGTLLVFGSMAAAGLAAQVSGAAAGFQVNTPNWRTSPMAYQFDGKQYIAIVSGGNIIAMNVPQ
jgi:hypothetical protein